MPSLTTIPILGHLLFSAAQLKLPTDDGWEQPQGDPNEDQYANDALAPDEKMAIPGLIPPWFYPQNMNVYHQDSCDDRGESFKTFHDDAIDNVKNALDMWRLQAKFKDLQVMALAAIGTPGCLDGPELKDTIPLSLWPNLATEDNDKKYRQAVADGVSKCFKEWQDNVMVPGLPWYPAFVAFPGPMAPPMPNVPMPLIACISSKMTQIIMPDDMKSAMIDALDQGIKDEDPDKQHEVLFESIATVLSLAFIIWLASQQVMLVLGKGPIPTFAPPYVPVGPVVAGDNIAIPGHLIA